MHYSINILRAATGIALLLATSLAGCNTPESVQNDQDGFVSMFDGETLNGWEGDTTYWRVENKIVVGEITPSTPLEHNSFLIWRGGQTADFELKTDYRITAEGNSGINYRSEEVSGIPFALKGYQADIDGKNTYTGLNYEERGRTFLARRGEIASIETGQQPVVVGSPGSSDSLMSLLKPNDWNEYHLIVKGNHLQHYINGVLMSDFTDNDTANRKMSGLLGLQVHTGPPMKVEFRNLRMKKL